MDQSTRIGWLLVGASFAIVVVGMTVPFLGKVHDFGDLAYHRGVALSVGWDRPFGEGPIQGVLSYYGGLFHIGLRGLSVLGGLSFEQSLDVLSLAVAPLWPLSLLVLGRRLWPGDILTTGLFVLLGTVAMPLTMRFDELWVESTLPSGLAFWPAYPRDIAIALGVLAVACALSDRRIVRVAGAGVLLGVAASLQVQVAVLMGWVAIALSGWTGIRDRDRVRLVDIVLAVGVAIVVSAWWWLPRVALALDAPLLLADAPDRNPLRLGPVGAIRYLGLVGLIGAVGGAAALLRRPIARSTTWLALWIVALLPVVVVDRLIGGSSFAPERRTWLLISIPLVAFAAAGIVGLARVPSSRRWLVVPVVAALVVATVPAFGASVQGVVRIWTTERIAGRDWPAQEWSGAIDELTAMADAQSTEILTYDTEAPWIWSLTGAQVYSLWLPGSIKLGFDPGPLTGRGFLDRVDDATAAFDDGIDGICRLASAREIDAILLRSVGGLVATHDHSFGAPYRTDPVVRGSTPPERPVEPGIDYVDTGPDWLQVKAGTEIDLPFSGRLPRAVIVEFQTVDRAPASITLRAGDRTIVRKSSGRNPVSVVRFALPGDRAGQSLHVSADQDVRFLRAMGLERLALDHPDDGAFLVTPKELCGTPDASARPRLTGSVWTRALPL